MARRIRLASGLVLLAYVATHLLNAALGLVSLDAMETGRGWFLALWRNRTGTVLLYGSLSVHFFLAVRALYARRSLRMRPGEAAQLLLGAAIVPLLATHAVGTRLLHEIAGVNDTYAYVLIVHFRLAPTYIAWQTAGLLAAWIHGAIGAHYWLRLRPGYARWRMILFAAALLLPVLALLGYVQAGREVLSLYNDPDWNRATLAAIHWPGRDALRAATRSANAVFWASLAAFAAALAARALRAALERRRGLVRVAYPDGRVSQAPPGHTILEISRLGRVPHASVCGGRGRCSTCRVRVTLGLEHLPLPSAAERRVLERIGSPIGVRLACQARPSGDLTVVPLLPPGAGPREARARSPQLNGREREIVILFADLRSFTQFSEMRLPYDVVFVLNQYFAAMGHALEESGGRLDKFIGDGVMALFGLEGPVDEACRQSLSAARGMARRLENLNHALAEELPEPLRIGIGLHAGPAIVGEMGYGHAVQLTAIGDAVNTASRLESMTKEFGAQLVVSDEVARRAGVDLSAHRAEDVPVRGRTEPIRVRIVEDASGLGV